MVKSINSRKTMKRKYRQRGGFNNEINSFNKTMSNKVNNYYEDTTSSLVDKGFDKANEVIEDVSKDVVKGVSKNVETLTNVMKGPEGQKLVQNLTQLTGTLKPVLDKTAEIGNEFIKEEAKTLTKAGLDVLGTVPVIGEVEEGIRVASDLVRAGEKSIEAGAEMTGVGMDYVKDTSELLKDTYNSISNIFTSFWNNPTIENAEQQINNGHQIGGKIIERTNESINEFNNNNNNKTKKRNTYNIRRMNKKKNKSNKIRKYY